MVDQYADTTMDEEEAKRLSEVSEGKENHG